jgi:hypothetical protein
MCEAIVVADRPLDDERRPESLTIDMIGDRRRRALGPATGK